MDKIDISKLKIPEVDMSKYRDAVTIVTDMTSQKIAQLKRRMDELGPFETAKMLKAWELAKTFASDVGQKKPYIYWEDVEKIIKKARSDYGDDFIGEDAETIILQRLEQKVWIP